MRSVAHSAGRCRGLADGRRRAVMRHGVAAILLIAAIGYWTGCGSSSAARKAHPLSEAFFVDSSDEILSDCSTGANNPAPVGLIFKGDYLLIEFTRGPRQAGSISLEQMVGTDGNITLLSNQVFRAAGKMRWNLEKEIKERYPRAGFDQVIVRTRA